MHTDTNGWIKLHRRIAFNEELMRDSVAFIIFIKLLILCDRNSGMYSCGRVKLGKMAGCPPTTAYDALKRLSKNGMVRLDPNNKFTDIYITNWIKYQNSEKNDDFGRQVHRQEAVRFTVSETPLLNEDTPSAVNNTSVSQPSLNKKRETRIKTHKEFFIEDLELREAFSEFTKMRNKLKKPMTDRAKKLIMTKLQDLYPDNVGLQIKAIDQSIEHSWQSVFPIKQDQAAATYKPEARQQTKQISDAERAKGRTKLAEIRQQLLDKKK